MCIQALAGAQERLRAREELPLGQVGGLPGGGEPAIHQRASWQRTEV